MIILITAVPGSGKTLYSITLIDEANKKKRPVFHNINGLDVSKFEHPDLIYPAPDDWRETPHGSLVIYDECQQPHLYPATAQRGAVMDERLTAMETQRHTGHDLVFITQAPTFVHHHVRKLVGEHVHLYRAHGVSGANRYVWSHACDSPNDRKEQQRADSVVWPFPKKYFSYYKSATIHTHKFKIPKKLIFIFSLAFMILLASGYGIYNNSLLSAYNGSQLPQEKASAQALAALPVASSGYDWSRTPETVPVAGCIANHDTSRCMCFSSSGVTLDMPHSQCLSVLNNPLPRSIQAREKKDA